MDAKKQSRVGVQTAAGSEEAVQQVLAYEHEVYLECYSEGKVKVLYEYFVTVDN